MARHLWANWRGAARLAAILTGVLCGMAMEPPPPGELPVEVLRAEKADEAGQVTLKFHETIMETKHGGEPQVCACRAVCFRVLQIVAGRRGGDVLKIGDMKQVRSGWASEANREMFCDMLGLPNGKFKHSSDAPACDKPGLTRAWWEFKFNDGKTITVWATEKALPAHFVDLHDRHKRDGKDVPMAIMKSPKELLAQTLTTTPLNELFVVSD